VSTEKYDVFLEHSFDGDYRVRVVDHGTGQFQAVFLDTSGVEPRDFALTGLVDYEKAKVAFTKAVIEDDPETMADDMFEAGFADAVWADDWPEGT